jgi:hypothetical protein
MIMNKKAHHELGTIALLSAAVGFIGYLVKKSFHLLIRK